MNTGPSLTELLKKLRLPALEQNSLSFCDSSKASRVAAWAAQLPATQITHTSVLLYQALPEITRLDTSAGNRLEMLEHLRPYVQQCIQGLAQSFLHQPLAMPNEVMKMAVIAQALQKHMSNGYCQVIAGILNKRKDAEPKAEEIEQLSKSLHRAMTGLGLQYLRNAQIYTQITSQLWLELNTLYIVADQLLLLKKNVKDPLLKAQQASSIEQSYQRVLLLACSRPNQLRQQEVNSVYDALEQWSKFTSLSPIDSGSKNLFSLDLGASFPPSYKSQWEEKNQQSPELLRELNFNDLLENLSKQDTESGQGAIEIPSYINARLLDHLTISWGIEHHREQPRRVANGVLEIALGLTNVHFHLAHQQSFEKYMREFGQQKAGIGSQFDARGLSGTEDPWADAFDAEKGFAEPGSIAVRNLSNRGPAAKSEKHPTYQVQMSDSSPGGFCLDWRQNVPSQAKTGELVAVREPRRHQWNLGVIRWVKQHKATSQLGIQLIAQQARAIAAQQLQKTGDDNVFMRAFMSEHAGEQLDQAAIITATVPFQKQNKVNINDSGAPALVQLTDSVYATSSINLFSYRTLESNAVAAETAPAKPDSDLHAPPEDEFSSDW
ncbi:MAG: hypothetical protein ACRBBW_11715 [Cellvibrionaceae bacterium]